MTPRRAPRARPAAAAALLAATLAAGCDLAPSPVPPPDPQAELRGACILAMQQRWPGGSDAAVYPTAGWPVLEAGAAFVVLVPLKGGASLHCRVRRVPDGILVETLG